MRAATMVLESSARGVLFHEVVVYFHVPAHAPVTRWTAFLHNLTDGAKSELDGEESMLASYYTGLSLENLDRVRCDLSAAFLP